MCKGKGRRQYRARKGGKTRKKGGMDNKKREEEGMYEEDKN